MSYILMTVSIVLSVVNACLLRKYSSVEKNGFNTYMFNAGVSLVWLVILTCLLMISDNSLNPVAIGYGAAYGVILFAFLLFKTQSMASGPVSLSTLIGSCAFVIATFFGVVYCNETVSISQLIGMAMLFLALILCVNPKKSNEKLTKKWMLYCLGFFLAGGFVGILYKLFGKSSASGEHEVMLLTAAIVSTLLFLIFGLTRAKKSGGSAVPNKQVMLFILLSGIASCSYIRLNLTLSNIIPSVIFFPVSNGGMVILSTVGGKLLFKERLTSVQLLGIAIGCVAVVITGCGDYLLGLIF